MQTIWKITPHKAVSAFFVDIQPGAAGNDNMRFFLVGIKEAFEKGFPFAVFM